MKYAAVLLLGLCTCATPSQSLHFEIKNATLSSLVFTVGEGVFQRTIVLHPGEEWLGSIDPKYVPRRLPVVITER